MKKLMTKYWGLVLVVVLLSSLFVGTAAPVSGANYFMFNSFLLPAGAAGDTIISPVTGLGLSAMAVSGDTIYISSTNITTGADHIYKSIDGGATWSNLNAAVWLGAGTFDLIAVAPDDPNVVCVVNTTPAFGDVVFLSTTGGAMWSALTATTANLNSIAISPTNGFARYITVGGNTVAPAFNSAGGYVMTWTMGAAAPAWTAPVGFLPTTLITTSVPAGATGNVTLDDVEAVAFSPNFLADQALLIVTESVAAGTRLGECALHVYSFNTFNWDAAIDVSFPRVIENVAAGNSLTVAKADIALDANFFLADEAAQIGFIGADITTNATAQSGGIYRVGTYTVAGGVETMTQIVTGTAIGDVAWDGTNLMAAQNAAGGNIWRSSTALGVVPAFLQNTTLKSPATAAGMVNGLGFTTTTAIASSNGTGTAFSVSADYGKSWDGSDFMTTLSFATITDFWTSPDGSVKYYVADDGTDTSVWRQSAGDTKRIMNLTTTTGQVWLVRADADNPDSVYIGRQTATNMYKSIDGGTAVWTARSASAAIADFAVQDANTVYVASAIGFVYKSTNGAFTWGLPSVIPTVNSGGGVPYSLNLISDDNMLVGCSAGGLAYTADGGATYNAVGGIANLAAGNVVATADCACGLVAGTNIYAATTNAAGVVSVWTIGTSFMWTGIVASPGNGIALSNGVLYVMDNVGGFVVRIIEPSSPTAIGEAYAEVGAYTQGVNDIQAITAGTTSTIYAINAAAIDTLDGFSDYLTSATTVPTPIYPLSGTTIDVNSISGAVAGFTFQWASPGIVTFPAATYRYDVQVYLDEAGTILVATTGVAPTPAALTGAATVSIASGVGGMAFVGNPGVTYFWRVRVSAGLPAQSIWSTMQSFTIQQLTAVVPELASPVNGTSITAGTTPAFSWSPISGAATYSFEVSTDPDFATTIYSTTTNTAGASIPSSVSIDAGTTYFWRVKALTPTEGEWSTVGNFVVAEPVVVPTTQPAVTTVTTIVNPTPTNTTFTIPVVTPTTTEVNPSYIWAIIIIGAVLVIAVIVLIVRTRRSV